MRVLKPGGEVILSDFRKTGEYARELRREGLKVKQHWPNLLTTFPPLWIVTARKSAAKGGLDASYRADETRD